MNSQTKALVARVRAAVVAACETEMGEPCVDCGWPIIVVEEGERILVVHGEIEGSVGSFDVEVGNPDTLLDDITLDISNAVMSLVETIVDGWHEECDEAS